MVQQFKPKQTKSSRITGSTVRLHIIFGVKRLIDIINGRKDKRHFFPGVSYLSLQTYKTYGLLI